MSTRALLRRQAHARRNYRRHRRDDADYARAHLDVGVFLQTNAYTLEQSQAIEQARKGVENP